MKITIAHTADKPPLFMWNRYPSGIIGAAIRVAARRQVSIVWGRPSYQPCCGRWGRGHYTHCRNHTNGAGAVGSGVQRCETATDRLGVAAIEDTDSPSSPPRPTTHADGSLT